MVSPAQRQVDLASAIRRIEAAVGSVWQRLTPRVLRALMAASIIASFAYFQLTYPITVGDTDMWYHLADGRYMVEQGGFADTFYYSFVGWPEGPGLHSWLFQLTIYLAHEAAGYWGLLLLRASLSIAGVCGTLSRDGARPGPPDFDGLPDIALQDLPA